MKKEKAYKLNGKTSLLVPKFLCVYSFPERECSNLDFLGKMRILCILEHFPRTITITITITIYHIISYHIIWNLVPEYQFPLFLVPKRKFEGGVA